MLKMLEQSLPAAFTILLMLIPLLTLVQQHHLQVLFV
jgi:hypothetical protein